jgi:Mu transposase, C-terminal domain
MVGYIKGNFFLRYREFESLEHMNEHALVWLAQEADRRVHGTGKEVVSERFEREAPHLAPLPTLRYDTSYREHRFVSWDGYIDVKGNRYSVPEHLCGKMVAIRPSLDGRLVVSSNDITVAEHWLRSAREGWVRVPSHHSRLWDQALAVERRRQRVSARRGSCGKSHAGECAGE